MPSKWRWCPSCRRWFYPEPTASEQAQTRCPVCQRESVSSDEAPGAPPKGDTTA